MEAHPGRFSQSPAALQLLSDNSQKSDIHHGGKKQTVMVHVQEDRAAQQTGSRIKSLLLCANHGWFSYFFKMIQNVSEHSE